MPISYIQALAEQYPNVQCVCQGDGTVYEDLVLSGDVVPTKAELDASVLMLTQDALWVQIKDKRNLRKSSGVYVQGHWFHTNDTSRIQFLGLVMMGASIPTGIMWKTMTGAFVEMTPALASAIFTQISVHDTQTFGVAEAHYAAMLTAQDPEAYDFESPSCTPPWPQVFPDVYPNEPIY